MPMTLQCVGLLQFELCTTLLVAPLICACLLQGTANLVELGKRANVKQIVLVSSVGADEPFFPLNLLWGVSHLPSESSLFTCILADSD